jgi:endoglucanase
MGKMKSLPFIVALLCVTAGAPTATGQTMQRIFGRDTPAHRAALRFMRGVNLGNYLEYPPGHPARTQTYSAGDFSLIRAEGFDHVRVPVAWHLYAGPGPTFTLSNTIFTSADFVVNSALNQGLGVILDLHGFDAFMSDPAGNQEEFYAIWRQVAAHYSTAPSSVAFELLNEPNNNATTTVMNQVYPEAIRQIRLTNPNRTLFLGPGQWNGLGELKIESSTGLLFPDNDTNLIAAVHCYDPYYFTHQGAEWALPDTATTGVLFPGPPAVALQPDPSITHAWVLDWLHLYNTQPAAYNPSSAQAFRVRLQSARAWSDYYGRPVLVGEFGCYEKADAQSRVNFHREIRTLMDQQGLGWTMWDWKAGFHYIKAGQPDPPGLRDAMFPRPQLRRQKSGRLEWDGAVGKTYAVELTSSLASPLSWHTVSTQTLTSPQLLFYDPAPSPGGAGYFRVEWIK